MPPPPAILRDLLSTDVMVQALPPGNLHSVCYTFLTAPCPFNGHEHSETTVSTRC